MQIEELRMSAYPFNHLPLLFISEENENAE